MPFLANDARTAFCSAKGEALARSSLRTSSPSFEKRQGINCPVALNLNRLQCPQNGFEIVGIIPNVAPDESV